MTKFVNVADIVNPKTGKTWRQENLEKQHKIPLGSLVEVKFDTWFGDGACWKVHARMWVVSHDRDCDGTPLYSISRWNDPEFAKVFHKLFNGFPEESLTVVPITQDLIDGVGAIKWDEQE